MNVLPNEQQILPKAGRDFTGPNVNGTKTMQPVTRKLSHTQDSDSGHERTSSSSASNCSEDAVSEQHYVESTSLNDDDHQTDCFVDASEDFQGLESGAHYGETTTTTTATATIKSGHKLDTERASLKVRLDETTQILRLALSNEFAKALELCEDRAKSELYASLAQATLTFLRAALTLEPNDLRAALASINQSAEVSQSKRRQVSAASIVIRFLYKPNYNTYTDDEIHAELVNAESMLLLSLISFLADQSVLCLVKGAFRIRACYQRYKECLYIMDTRDNWSSEEARTHFESGVRMGYGIFNLLMSYLPRRVLKFLEYVGFSGSRSVGVDELDKSIELDDGLRSVLSALVILTYHSYVENIFGLGYYDDAKVEQLNNTFLGHYPDSAFFLLFLGRYHQMQGNLEQAIASFEKCCQVQQDWKQFHSICHWEIMWCYACQMNWPKAAHYSDLLRQHSRWSPSSYQYQYGTFLYAQLVQEQRAGLVALDSSEYSARMGEIREIIEKVPSLRIRYAGKTIPADKFAITRSLKFCQQNNCLSLPALEFLYIWNIFSTLKNNLQQVEKLLACVDNEIIQINKSLEESTSNQQEQQHQDDQVTSSSENAIEDGQMHWVDNLCLVYLLKGMCLKHLKRYQEAESMFKRVIDHEHQIRVDTFLVPHSAMELAILNLHLKQYDTARQWIKQARHNYTGYLMETIVHFRLHAASRIIRIEQQQQAIEDSYDQSPCPSPSEQSIGRRH